MCKRCAVDFYTGVIEHFPFDESMSGGPRLRSLYLGTLCNVFLPLGLCWVCWYKKAQMLLSLDARVSMSKAKPSADSVAFSYPWTVSAPSQAVYTGGTNKARQPAAIFFIYFFILFWISCFDATQYLYAV